MSYISELLNLFIDLYERSPGTLEFLLKLEDPFGSLDALDSSVPDADQLRLLIKSHLQARSEIMGKTLIETSKTELLHANLRARVKDFDLDPNSIDQELNAYRPLIPVKMHPDLIALWDGDIESAFSLIAAAHGMSQKEWEAKLASDGFRQQLSEKKTRSELLRFFAGHLDGIANAIDKLNGAEFDRTIPRPLHVPFRELHINFVMSNYGTTLILCGALLERTLQDVLQSGELLNRLISIAKTKGVIVGRYNKFADRIRDDRNDVVHGRVPFSEVTSKRAWETIEHTRKLVSALYQDRVTQE